MAAEQPLEGVTVVDFGRIYSGPYCGFLLAQAEARVIKAESPRRVALRFRMAETESVDEASAASYPFALLNANKECMTLNFKTGEVPNLLNRLVQDVNVLEAASGV